MFHKSAREVRQQAATGPAASILGVFLVLGAAGVWGGVPALAQEEGDVRWGVDEGQRIFISAGCIGCHGKSGRGGVGPDLANTELIMDSFQDQVRDPRDRMPVFPPDAISDVELSKVYSYV
ncbi:MAG: c-type cytochrome, partial [Candidatus Eisenbacteria bacterium]|nr:c-type cytochrome [Candidatus Eisenbacteria bacterium]